MRPGDGRGPRMRARMRGLREAIRGRSRTGDSALRLGYLLLFEDEKVASTEGKAGWKHAHPGEDYRLPAPLLSRHCKICNGRALW